MIDLDVSQVLDDRRGEFSHRGAMPEANRDPGCIRRESQNAKLGVAADIRHVDAILYRRIEIANRLCASVRVVRQRRTENRSEVVLQWRRDRGPEHCRCVADLHALWRALAQQMIQRRRVGERSFGADRRVGALLPAKRLECIEIERDDVRAG